MTTEQGKQITAKDRLIIALDFSSEESVSQLTEKLGNHVHWYKVGMELFYSTGKSMVESLASQGKKIFLDLKFHDIPNTAAQASRAAARMGVAMFNVHAGGGLDMMRQATEASRDESARLGIKPPLLVAVTVLTSMDQQAFRDDMRLDGTISDQVVHWAMLAQKAGLDGVVASAREAALIRQHCGADFSIVTPGIRPADAALDDQSRVMTPRMALEAGADFLVVGRPVTKEDDPALAATRILTEMESR